MKLTGPQKQLLKECALAFPKYAYLLTDGRLKITASVLSGAWTWLLPSLHENCDRDAAYQYDQNYEYPKGPPMVRAKR